MSSSLSQRGLNSFLVSSQISSLLRSRREASCVYHATTTSTFPELPSHLVVSFPFGAPMRELQNLSSWWGDLC